MSVQQWGYSNVARYLVRGSYPVDVSKMLHICIIYVYVYICIIYVYVYIHINDFFPLHLIGVDQTMRNTCENLRKRTPQIAGDIENEET